jgi:predicted nucleotidyltransferase
MTSDSPTHLRETMSDDGVDDTIRYVAENAAKQVDGTALIALAGSRAYGTDRPGSDVDLAGVYVAPTRDVLSLNPPKGSHRFEDRDVVLHELHQFCKLAAAANPTILEILWGPELYKTLDGGRLRVRRDLFLSRRVAKTYGGYAIAQLRKADAGTGGSRGVEHFKREKFLMHTLRLAEAGLHAIKTGEVLVRVPDPERLWERARRPLEVVAAEVEQLVARMDALVNVCALPEHPNFDAINQLIYEIRMDNAR